MTIENKINKIGESKKSGVASLANEAKRAGISLASLGCLAPTAAAFMGGLFGGCKIKEALCYDSAPMIQKILGYSAGIATFGAGAILAAPLAVLGFNAMYHISHKAMFGKPAPIYNPCTGEIIKEDEQNP